MGDVDPSRALRALLACALCAGAGCAAIAGIGEGSPEDDKPGVQATEEAGSTGSSSGSSGARTPADSGASSDAAPDGAAAGCQLPKKPNGSACSDATSCCGTCAESRKCVTSCKTTGSCSLGGDACCIGTYCSLDIGVKCQPCIKDGELAELYLGVPDNHSCCSGSASFTTKRCQR